MRRQKLVQRKRLKLRLDQTAQVLIFSHSFALLALDEGGQHAWQRLSLKVCLELNHRCLVEVDCVHVVGESLNQQRCVQPRGLRGSSWRRLLAFSLKRASKAQILGQKRSFIS